MSKTIETMHWERSGLRLPPLPRLGAAALVVVLAAVPAVVHADGSLLQQPSAVSPYRFNPPAQPMSPLEEQKADQYKGQLQQQIFNYDRSGKTLTPFQDDQLRGARGELFRMDQILTPPK